MNNAARDVGYRQRMPELETVYQYCHQFRSTLMKTKEFPIHPKGGPIPELLSDFNCDGVRLMRFPDQVPKNTGLIKKDLFNNGITAITVSTDRGHKLNPKKEIFQKCIFYKYPDETSKLNQSMVNTLGSYLKKKRAVTNSNAHMLRIDINIDFAGFFYMANIPKAAELIRRTWSHYGFDPPERNCSDVEESSTNLNLTWKQKGLDPRYEGRSVMKKRVNLYTKPP